VLKGLGARENQLLTAETLGVDLESRRKQLAEAEALGGKNIKKVRGPPPLPPRPATAQLPSC
jgi:hypothetical protein